MGLFDLNLGGIKTANLIIAMFGGNANGLNGGAAILGWIFNLIWLGCIFGGAIYFVYFGHEVYAIYTAPDDGDKGLKKARSKKAIIKWISGTIGLFIWPIIMPILIATVGAKVGAPGTGETTQAAAIALPSKLNINNLFNTNHLYHGVKLFNLI